MDTMHEAIAAPVARTLDDRSGEIATEFGDGDTHDDPEAPNPLPPTEAAEAVGQWRVAKCLPALRAQLDVLAPNRRKASDGTIGDVAHCGSASSTSDHCPRIVSGGVGVVAAMDITHDPDRGCNAAAIADSIHASRDARVKYIIWNRRIANSSAIDGSPPWTWRPYGGSNPHDKHVHVSVKADASLYDSERSWAVELR